MEDKMKNIVVLKNLPSNLIDEAIVILKADKKVTSKVKKQIQKENQNMKKSAKPKDYIVKEAEMVISNYISNLESQKLSKNKVNIKRIEKKYKIMKVSMIIMTIALILNIF